MRSINITFLVAASFGFAFTVQGSDTSLESNIKPRLATDEVENQISMDREANPLYESALLSPIKDWRGGVAEKTGFNWSLDYSALLMGVSDSSGEDNAAGGMARFFGYWDMVNRGGPNKGSLNWKIENRHKYSDIAPSGVRV